MITMTMTIEYANAVVDDDVLLMMMTMMMMVVGLLKFAAVLYREPFTGTPRRRCNTCGGMSLHRLSKFVECFGKIHQIEYFPKAPGYLSYR